MNSYNSPQIYRKPDLKAIFSFADSTLYLHVSQGILPKPISLSSRARGWPATEIDAIVSARIAGKSEADIKALVVSLTAARQSS
jgi:prophage regulatory protein